MKKKLEASYFSHKGKRNTNEDYLISDPDNRIFIIADGLGGYGYGEIASELVANLCHKFLLAKKISSQEEVNELLDFILKEIENHLQDNPAHYRMGTTLACVQINGEFFSSIHIGDTRIYQIDLSSLEYWRTRDDTYVQELVDEKIITKEQAEVHTLKNIITKSILADKKSKELQFSFTFRKIESKSCLIFLCTDGVIESYTEKSLLHHLRGKKSMKNLMNEIEMVTLSRSKDNASAILVLIST